MASKITKDIRKRVFVGSSGLDSMRGIGLMNRVLMLDARHVCPYSLPQCLTVYDRGTALVFSQRKALEYMLWNTAGTINHSISVTSTLQI